MEKEAIASMVVAAMMNFMMSLVGQRRRCITGSDESWRMKIEICLFWGRKKYSVMDKD